jgi:trans-2,3-dihydro-3-hydroxyanthranilate isomerase
VNYEVIQVDAFASKPLEGNPCAVLPDARGLDDALMQRIAREMNLSETAYVFPGERTDFRVRYFTPTSEIPMAGHPTVATVHALCELGIIGSDRSSVTLEMPAGIIPVRIEREYPKTRYTMRQLAPKFLRKYPRELFAQALDLGEDDFLDDHPLPQTVSTGTPQLMIALRDAASLERARPDVRKLFSDVDGKDYFSIHVFARETSGDVAVISRHFADFAGNIVEDPFTGSASGGMAAYCAHYGLIEERSYQIAQGDHVGRPGRGYIRVVGEGDAIEAVEVGGEAVTVLRGTLSL